MISPDTIGTIEAVQYYNKTVEQKPYSIPFLLFQICLNIVSDLKVILKYWAKDKIYQKIFKNKYSCFLRIGFMN